MAQQIYVTVVPTLPLQGYKKKQKRGVDMS